LLPEPALHLTDAPRTYAVAHDHPPCLNNNGCGRDGRCLGKRRADPLASVEVSAQVSHCQLDVQFAPTTRQRASRKPSCVRAITEGRIGQRACRCNMPSRKELRTVFKFRTAMFGPQQP
jgi:hypothetical protein